MRRTLFILALVVRLAAIEGSGATRTTFGDAADYIAHARTLCTQHVYPERGNLPFFRAPGLPFFIAAATACHPDDVRLIKYALALCDAVTCALLASLALMLFDRRTAWLAGLGAVLHPLFIASVLDVRSEPLFMLLLVLAIHELVRRKYATSGMALALAALTRPSALLCIPLFAVYAAVRSREPRRVPAWITFLGAAALTMAPWVIHNYVRYHELIAVTDAGGFSLWRGSHPEVIALSHATGETYRRKAWDFETKTIAQEERSIVRAASTPESRSRAWRRAAIANLKANPPLQLRWLAEKAWLYWRPWLNPQEYGRAVVWGSGAGVIVLYVLAAIGLARFEQRSAVIVFFTVMWLAHLPYQISMRLRIPYVEPLAIVLAASAIARLIAASRDTTHADADTQSRSAVPARS